MGADGALCGVGWGDGGEFCVGFWRGGGFVFVGLLLWWFGRVGDASGWNKGLYMKVVLCIYVDINLIHTVYLRVW